MCLLLQSALTVLDAVHVCLPVPLPVPGLVSAVHVGNTISAHSSTAMHSVERQTQA